MKLVNVHVDRLHMEQIWNKDKCRCECKEDLLNKIVCDKGYI